MKLSTDLRFFFEPAHETLAEALVGLRGSPLDDHDRPLGEVARALGAEHDLYRWLVPEDGAVDVRALCLIREALGYVSPLADAIFAVQGLGAYPLLLAGSDEQRAILPDVRAGRRIGGFGLTEPGAGSDVAALSTRAVRADSGGWRLSGQKTFISNVGIADFFTVFATVDPEQGHRGITAFFVPADAPGLRLETIPMSGDHPVGMLHFDECHLPDRAVIGEVGGGFRLAMRTLDTFRVSVGAAAVGMARRALDAAREHVMAREQFGKPLSAQQMVQAYLADMATELDAARLLVYRAAWNKDQAPTERATLPVSMAKLYATEAAQQIIDKAVQLFGGLGVVSGQVVERLYREIRPLRIYEGTSEIQRVIIARELLR